MSQFDDNPFGPPTVDNPFADPSVTQVTQQSSSVQRGLEEFNPFADQPNLHTTNRRQEELERKAAELQRREEELRNAPYNVRRNNWPPLPENCCGLEPCFYQDINIEIPVDFQTVVRQLYYVWIFHTLLLFANVIGTLAALLHRGAFSMFGLSIIYTLLLTPFSFLCWYRPGYKAFRSDSSFNFMVFFFLFFFQFIITTIQAMGFKDGGSCGIIIALSSFDGTVGGIITGIISMMIAIGFVTAAFLDIIMLSKVHRIYRSSGASMAKAQAEFTSEFLKNEHVRGAATSAATAAMQSQFQPQRSPPSRY
ncbi:unnamed protein product [Nesidiocoris tenuis]|uniref:Secretory carrier-associated membrane protein n=1 Tax=Nesidiocoris tenuis TaxID=355587 RepID=A0A6H5HVV7_9HEMI|nr:unnamed protein product [Nesidiocoris tenuis]